MPTIIGMSRSSRARLDSSDRVVVPPLDCGSKGPHPPVVRASEASDDGFSKRGRLYGVRAVILGGCPQRLDGRFPSEPRASVGEPEREKGHEIDEGHSDETVALALAEMHSLV